MNKELYRFLVTGVCAVGTDFSVYFILDLFINADIAKAIGFLAGSIFAYFVNKLWTFEQKEKSVYETIRFIALYASTFFVNVGINHLVLDSLSIAWIGILAFLTATAVSTILNFLGMKFFVFTGKPTATV